MQNFGITKNIFKEFLVEKLSTKKPYDKAKFKQVIKTLKENKILKKQFNVYTNIENLVENDDVNIYEYINENMSLFNGISKNQITEANKEFNDLVNEFVGDFKVDSDKNELYEAIDFLICNRSSEGSLNKRAAKKIYIKEYVKANKIIEKSTTEPVSLNMLSKIMVDKFNRKYESLDESEKLMIKSLMENTSEAKLSAFKAMVNECVGVVDSLMEDADDDLKTKLSLTKVKLNEMTFDESNFTDSMSKLVSLKNNLMS